VPLNNILSIATSGMSAAQAAIDTISNNVSNASTPGYTRQQISFSANAAGKTLNGVAFSAPERVASQFLENSVFNRSSQAGYDDTNNTYLGQLQSLLGAPDSKSGLGASLNRVQAAAISLTAPGAGQQATTAFVATVEDSLRTLQQTDADVKQLRLDAESEIAGKVPQINQLLAQIHGLNQQLGSVSAGLRSNADIDQRGLAIKKLSDLVSITSTDNPNGTVTIKSNSGNVLLDQQLRELSYSRSYDGGSEAFGAIGINFAAQSGQAAAPTGETIISSAIGGQLGGLLNIRDTELPAVRDNLASLSAGLAIALNKASNQASTAPALQTLTGRNTGLLATDYLNFTGKTTFAITDASGKLYRSLTIDLGTTQTINDLVGSINTSQIGFNAGTERVTANFIKGTLSIATSSSAFGISLVDDATSPADRAGTGFSEFFGLNDLVRSDKAQLVPTGLFSTEPHRFTGSTNLMLRDSTGRVLATQTIDFADPSLTSIQDVMTALGAGDLSPFGSFSFDSKGRFAFTPSLNAQGARIAVADDTSARGDTGVSFGSLSGFSNAALAPSNFYVRKDISISANKLPMATLSASATVGAIALGNSDRGGLNNYLVQLDKEVSVGNRSPARLQDALNGTIAQISLRADIVQRQFQDSSSRLSDAVKRRDAVSGVNVDEELASLVIFQNSYAASARVISTTQQMYDTLLSMIR
jgi:flagellar hook-associated protein 1